MGQVLEIASCIQLGCEGWEEKGESKLGCWGQLVRGCTQKLGHYAVRGYDHAGSRAGVISELSPVRDVLTKGGQKEKQFEGIPSKRC